MNRLKKGDLVAVRSGKDRGKQGKILRMLPDRGMALVERVNLTKHFERRSQQNQAGGIIERESPIVLDKLALVCPRCARPTRVGVAVSAKGGSASGGNGQSRQRICRKCKEAIGG